jgi:hypothetical protein
MPYLKWKLRSRRVKNKLKMCVRQSLIKKQQFFYFDSMVISVDLWNLSQQSSGGQFQVSFIILEGEMLIFHDILWIICWEQ